MFPAHTVPGYSAIALDTETPLIRPGMQAPPLVILQWMQAMDTGILHARFNRRDLLEKLYRWLDPGNTTIIQGHNIAFDMSVLCAEFPELFPLVFASYEAGKIRCTIVREKLLNIAEGKTAFSYALDDTCAKYPGVPVPNKQNPWRMRFGELLGTPVENFPEDALTYATGDIDSQWSLYLAQTRRAERFNGSNGTVETTFEPGGYAEGGVLTDQCRQSAADFWLKLMAAWGVHTDQKAVREYYDRKRAEIDQNRAELVSAGLVRPDGTRNTKAAQARMVQVCEAKGLDLRMTAGGTRGKPAPEMSEDAISLVGDSLLTKYAEFGSTTTLLSRIERLFHGGRYPIQPRYDSLLVTGRTSCSQGDTKADPPPAYGFQLQNPPTEPGVRDCFVPRPGRWFLFADWSGVELRTWASVCLWSLGFSRLAEVLRAGRDPHADLGSRLAGKPAEYGDAVMHGVYGPQVKQAFKKKERQTAKIGNFGFPGGMGPDALVEQARALYGVILTPEEAHNLRDAWRQNWPEAPEYFRWINALLGGGDSCTIRQFKSHRYRGDCGYCQAANSFFQGLAADVAKDAGFQLAKACYVEPRRALYGSRLWNFAHDEFMFEIPANPHLATVIAEEVRSIMVGASERWMPELSGAHEVSISLCASRWIKAAEPRYAESGRFKGCLIPWEWTTEEG